MTAGWISLETEVHVMLHAHGPSESTTVTITTVLHLIEVRAETISQLIEYL